MRLPGRVLASLISGTLFLITPAASQAVQESRCRDAPEVEVYGGACDNRIEIVVTDTSESRDGSGPASQSDAPSRKYQRQVLCGDWIVPVGGSAGDGSVSWEGEIPACVEPFVVREDFCPDGAEPLAPQWESVLVDPEGPTYGPWQMVSGYQCPEDPLVGAVADAWRAMVITPQSVDVLPSDGWAIATMGVKADLDDTAQTSTVTLLGTTVTLRATPVDTEWTVTDVVTGDRWPGVFETGSHGEDVIMFDRKEQRVRLGLTTTWEGHYSLNGGTTWIPAPGTATTTSEPRSVHVYNPRARLVNCDTMGDCMDGGTSRNPFTLTDPDADGIDNYEVPDDEIGAYLKARNNTQ